MKAKLISEELNFERGQDPKQAMELGQARDKKKLISMMSDPGKFPSSEDAKIQFDYMVQIILDPKTKVSFLKKHEEAPGDGRISILMPSSLTNVFFFEALGTNIARNNNTESYHWDNPDWNEMHIWINS